MQRYRLANNGLDLPNQSAPDWARVRAAMARPDMTPAQALRCAPGTLVKVRGVVRAGDAGPLVAPLSGRECAWYRSYVQPGTWALQPLPPQGRFSDIMLVAQPTNILWRRNDATDEISVSSFVVAGADGAALSVDPRVADVNSDHVARNRVESSRFGFLQQLLVEFVLPIGTAVVLLAVMGTDGRLAMGTDAFVFVSTRPDARIVDRAAHAAPGERSLTTAAFRFVRGGSRFRRRMRQVLVVGAVAFVLATIVFVLVVSLA